MSTANAYPGQLVWCRKGHVLGIVTKGLRPGDLSWGYAFWWFREQQPELGGPMPVCEHCGANVDWPGMGGNDPRTDQPMPEAPAQP